MMKARARFLRKNATESEKKLWYFLRDRRLFGFKFRRQYWFDYYIVDFVCLERKLIIELDGSQHAQQIAYDTKRTTYFENQGFRVIRFDNGEILNYLDRVLTRVYMELHGPSSALRAPSPTSREKENL